MKTLTRLFVMVTTLAFTTFCFAQDNLNADIVKQLEPISNKALEAYNAGDQAAFFKDYAKAMAAIATPQIFDTMYKAQHMANLGKLLSKELSKSETVAMEGLETPLLVYSAKFEKNANVKVAINFMKEEGAWKIMQVTFQPQ
jgi:ABC-type transporter MlaC component